MKIQEPSIKWKVDKWRTQGLNKCVSCAICSLLEKRLLEQKGLIVKLDENILDSKLRIHQKKLEGGLNTKKALDYLMDYGVQGYKISSYTTTNPHQTDLIRETLCYNPLLLSMNTYESWKTRAPEGVYRIGEQKKGSHLVVMMGYEDGYFLIQDSHYGHLCKLKEDYLPVMGRLIYDLSL